MHIYVDAERFVSTRAQCGKIMTSEPWPRAVTRIFSLKFVQGAVW